MKLDKDKARYYVAHDGCSCPYCGSTDIKADSIESQDSYIYQPVKCLSCGREWHDDYYLRGITPIGEDGSPEPENEEYFTDEELRAEREV